MIEFKLIDLRIFSFDNEFNIFSSLYYQANCFENDEIERFQVEIRNIESLEN